MIHSRKKDPAEIMEFAHKFRQNAPDTPLVVVPTSFNEVTDEELEAAGFNIIIYANHFTRAEVPAMQKVAKTILENHRSKECDEICMPFKEIIRLIPDEP
jgi:phosphoenolpyruvate phosphomutase